MRIGRGNEQHRVEDGADEGHIELEPLGESEQRPAATARPTSAAKVGEHAPRLSHKQLERRPTGKHKQQQARRGQSRRSGRSMRPQREQW